MMLFSILPLTSSSLVVCPLYSVGLSSIMTFLVRCYFNAPLYPISSHLFSCAVICLLLTRSFSFSDRDVLQHCLGRIQAHAFPPSTKRSMQSYMRSYLLFCHHFQFTPFPVTKQCYLFYLVFLARSLSSYRSVVNYLSILTHINRSLGSSLAFLHDYDVYLSKRAIRRLLGDFVTRKEPITVDILLRLFHLFDFQNPLHLCMRALFLVAFFSFLRISNLVPKTLADTRDPKACHLRPSSVTFTAQGAILRITRTKTIQFRQRTLEIPLPLIRGSPLCPVTALKQYLAHTPVSSQSPLFVSKSRGTYRPILAHQYNAFIKASVTALGLDPTKYSSHSFRRGGATFAFCCNAPTAFIKTQGDWKSDAYLVYLTLSNESKLKILNSITTRLSPHS